MVNLSGRATLDLRLTRGRTLSAVDRRAMAARGTTVSLQARRAPRRGTYRLELTIPAGKKITRRWFTVLVL